MITSVYCCAELHLANRFILCLWQEREGGVGVEFIGLQKLIALIRCVAQKAVERNLCDGQNRLMPTESFLLAVQEWGLNNSLIDCGQKKLTRERRDRAEEECSFSFPSRF